MESIEECAEMEIEAFEEKEINAPKVEPQSYSLTEIRVLIVSDPNAFKNRSIEECAKREIEAFEKKNLEASKKKDTKAFKDEIYYLAFVQIYNHDYIREIMVLIVSDPNPFNNLIYNHDYIREIMAPKVAGFKSSKVAPQRCCLTSRQDHILDLNALTNLINNTYENRVYNHDYIRDPNTYENWIKAIKKEFDNILERRWLSPPEIMAPKIAIMALFIAEIMALFVPMMALFVAEIMAPKIAIEDMFEMMPFIEQEINAPKVERRQDRVRRRQDRVRRRQDRVRRRQDRVRSLQDYVQVADAPSRG